MPDLQNTACSVHDLIYIFSITDNPIEDSYLAEIINYVRKMSKNRGIK